MYIKFLYWKRSLVNRKTGSLDLQISLQSAKLLKDEKKGQRIRWNKSSVSSRIQINTGGEDAPILDVAEKEEVLLRDPIRTWQLK